MSNFIPLIDDMVLTKQAFNGTITIRGGHVYRFNHCRLNEDWLMLSFAAPDAKPNFTEAIRIRDISHVSIVKSNE